MYQKWIVQMKISNVKQSGQKSFHNIQIYYVQDHIRHSKCHYCEQQTWPKVITFNSKVFKGLQESQTLKQRSLKVSKFRNICFKGFRRIIEISTFRIMFFTKVSLIYLLTIFLKVFKGLQESLILKQRSLKVSKLSNICFKGF